MTDEWERICRTDEVRRGQPLGRVIGDTGADRDRVCVVARGNGEYVALLDRCPHEDVALSEGSISGGDLLCSGHFWTFDLATGKCVDQPWQRVTRYPTRVVDGWVEAQVPPPAT